MLLLLRLWLVCLHGSGIRRRLGSMDDGLIEEWMMAL